jgi:hypothetical protein
VLDAASPENALTLGARNYTLALSLMSLLKKALPSVRIKSPGVIFAGLSRLARREPFEPDALYLWSVGVCDIG